MKDFIQALDDFQSLMISYTKNNSHNLENQIIATFYPELNSEIPYSLLIKVNPTKNILEKNTEVLIDEYRFSTYRKQKLYNNNICASIVSCNEVQNSSINYLKYLKIEFDLECEEIELYINDEELFSEIIDSDIYSEYGNKIGKIGFLDDYGYFTNFTTEYLHLYEYKILPKKYNFLKCKTGEAIKTIFIGLSKNIVLKTNSIDINIIPIVNLYKMRSDTIYLDHYKAAYNITSSKPIFAIESINLYDSENTTELHNGIDYTLNNNYTISFQKNFYNKMIYADLLCIDNIRQIDDAKIAIEGMNNLQCTIISKHKAGMCNKNLSVLCGSQESIYSSIANISNIYNIDIMDKIYSIQLSKTYGYVNDINAWKTCVPKNLFSIHCADSAINIGYILAKVIFKKLSLQSINEVIIKTNVREIKILDFSAHNE